MEDELRLILLFAGTCFIIAVLAHGIWKIRKSSKPVGRPRVEPRQWGDTHEDEETSTSEGFDELGIGQVRVVKSGHKNASANESATVDEHTSDDRSDNDDTLYAADSAQRQGYETSDLTSDASTGSREQGMSQESDEKVGQDSVSDEAPKKESQPKLYGSVVSNPKPHLQGQGSQSSDMPDAFPEPPGFLLKDSDESSTDAPEAQKAEDAGQFSPAQSNDTAPDNSKSVPATDASRETLPEVETKPFYSDSPNEQAPSPYSASEVKTEVETVSAPTLSEHKRAVGKRTKPISRKRQEPSFGDDQMRIDFDDNDGAHEQPEQPDNSESTNSSSSAQEVLVLNVRAPSEQPISGAALLPILLTLGFKFGDQNIFHRHVNSNGKGPVLFSLANMFKPGVFDIDNIETFTTQGVSLFMILPIEGESHQVFNMMHNAARKLSDEFGAQVLDGRRSVLTKQGLQQYMEKIREFERKRMISR